MFVTQFSSYTSGTLSKISHCSYKHGFKTTKGLLDIVAQITQGLQRGISDPGRPGIGQLLEEVSLVPQIDEGEVIAHVGSSCAYSPHCFPPRWPSSAALPTSVMFKPTTDYRHRYSSRHFYKCVSGFKMLEQSLKLFGVSNR
uniref:Uncharacterized protein n=1 Tax=Physcomitrium patens TaxID=3218 RepID=A9RKN0_PHYPA|nr:hypothetical protein PHYPA_009277 [Physcomitrium patens]